MVSRMERFASKKCKNIGNKKHASTVADLEKMPPIM